MSRIIEIMRERRCSYTEAKRVEEQEAQGALAAPTGSDCDDDGACQRCGRFYDLREGQEPTPLCDECAQAEWAIFRRALERILEFPVHSEPVGGAMAMKDIAHDALHPQNAPHERPPTKTL